MPGRRGGRFGRSFLGPASQPVPFDVMVNFSAGSGALTATHLNNGTHGANWGTWTSNTINYSTIVDHAVVLPFKLLVDGDLYDGSEGQGMRFDFTGEPTTSDEFQYTISPLGSRSGVICLCLLRAVDMVWGGANYHNDTLNFAGSNYSVPQLRLTNLGLQIVAHSEGNLGRNVDIAAGTWYLVWTYHNAAGEFTEVIIQDASTLAVVGSTYAEALTPAGDLVYIKFQAYLRGVDQGEGHLDVKLFAFGDSVTPWPPVTLTVPAATSVEAEQTDENELTLTWVNSCQIFKIERNVDGGGWTTLETAFDNNGVHEYVDTDVADGESIEYRVTAIIGSQVSSAAASAAVEVDNGPFATPTWTDAIAGASTDTTETNDGCSIRQPVTSGTTGNCTRLRVWCRNFNFAANIKMALYDDSNNLLGHGSVSSVSPSSGSWQEVVLNTPVAVTSSTTYRVGVSVSSAGVQTGYLAGGNSSLIDFGVAYAAFPADPWSTANNVSRTVAVGMGVVP
jgi:hypothetical protein